MKKILYVEDSEDTAEAVKIILAGAGYEIETASTGTEGIKKAKSTFFDLILLDVMLPDMSGCDIFELLSPKIKSKYAFLSAIPISSERLDQLNKTGICDYIPKPFLKDDLVKRIQVILS